jgi:hypothetical protein
LVKENQELKEANQRLMRGGSQFPPTRRSINKENVRPEIGPDDKSVSSVGWVGLNEAPSMPFKLEPTKQWRPLQ